jgi:uncharacterized cupredoxin-like copper-binding protein
MQVAATDAPSNTHANLARLYPCLPTPAVLTPKLATAVAPAMCCADFAAEHASITPAVPAPPLYASLPAPAAGAAPAAAWCWAAPALAVPVATTAPVVIAPAPVVVTAATITAAATIATAAVTAATTIAASTATVATAAATVVLQARYKQQMRVRQTLRHASKTARHQQGQEYAEDAHVDKLPGPVQHSLSPSTSSHSAAVAMHLEKPCAVDLCASLACNTLATN